MNKLIVKLPRSEGDVLVRMKSIYESIENSGSSFKFIRMPATEAYLLKRKGIPYSVSVDSEAADVVKALLLGIIDPSKMPQDSYLPDEAVVNQTGCVLAQKDEQNYTITADFSKLEKYVLNYEDFSKQGEQYWLAVGVSTGENTIIGISYNGIELTDSDIANAALNGLSDGGFVYWIALEENSTNRLIIEKDGKSTVVNIMIMNQGD